MGVSGGWRVEVNLYDVVAGTFCELSNTAGVAYSGAVWQGWLDYSVQSCALDAVGRLQARVELSVLSGRVWERKKHV